MVRVLVVAVIAVVVAAVVSEHRRRVEYRRGWWWGRYDRGRYNADRWSPGFRAGFAAGRT